MKLTNADLYASKDAFKRLLEHDDIPVKYAFKIIKLVKKFDDDYAAIEEQRIGLIKKYGTEENGQVKINQNDENFSKFVVDFNELMKIEIEVDYEKVKIPDNITIPGNDLVSLEPFIEIVEG
jgi:hypothetical protein